MADDSHKANASHAHHHRTVADNVITAGKDANTGTGIFVAVAGGAKKLSPQTVEKILGPEKAKAVLAAAKNLGEIDPAVLATLKRGTGATNIVLTVADGVNQVSKEHGTRHKLQRTGAVVATDTVSVLPGVIAPALETGVAATGAAATGVTVAAVAIPAAAGYMVNKDANTIIETDRLYERVDAAFQPDPTRHSNLIGVEKRLVPQLKALEATYDGKGRLDLSKSGNVAKLQQAIGHERLRLEGVIEDNHSMLPREMAITSKQLQMRGNTEDAVQELRLMNSASAELNDFRQLIAERKQAAASHHDHQGPVTHGLAGQGQERQPVILRT